MPRHIKRNALNRGSCVYLGGDRVRFLWPCGCKHIERVKAGRHAVSADAVARLSNYWRAGGVILRQCKKHPDWYSRFSQVNKLNAENPQGEVDESS